MTCKICGGVSLGPICAMCAMKADPRELERVQRESTAPVRARAYQLTEEPASKVQQNSHSGIRDNLDEWVPNMVRYLESRDYFNSTAATSVGDQHTPSDCESGTMSLDFQGVRKGTSDAYYIDLQAQVGGGSTKRLSYAQVLIQTCVGKVPTDVITRALRQSLQASAGTKNNPSGVRVVIHVEGAAMPK